MTHEQESVNPQPTGVDGALIDRLDDLARRTRAEPGTAFESRIAMASGAPLRDRAHRASHARAVIGRIGAPTTPWLAVAAAVAILGVASVVVVRISSRAPAPAPAETEEIALERDLDTWLDTTFSDTNESTIASVFDELDAIDDALAQPWPVESDSDDQEAM